jgi:hypothetical protein
MNTQIIQTNLQVKIILEDGDLQVVVSHADLIKAIEDEKTALETKIKQVVSDLFSSSPKELSSSSQSITVEIHQPSGFTPIPGDF